MPIIKILYDETRVQKSEVEALAVAVQKVVSDLTQIEDTSVFANYAKVKVKTAPIEIFVELSAHKIADADALNKQFSEALGAWKKESGFAHPINLSLIPMPWKIEIGI